LFCHTLTYEQHEHPADINCIALPDEKHFTELRKTRKPRTTPLSRTPTDPAIPTMHIRIPGYAQSPEDPDVFVDSTNPNAPSGSNELSQGHTRQFALSDKESDDDNEVDIRQILDILAAKFSSLDFHQYEHQLRRLGISYLSIATMFDLEFFILKVGMSEGAARLFYCHVIKEMDKREGKEEVSCDDE